MSYKILLSGYFGFDNAGDEAILSAMVKGIREELKDVDIVALSAHPDLTASKNNIRSIDRMGIMAIMKEMKDMDLFISGGGSLFQDVTSKRSILYYLGTLFLAKTIFRKKVMIFSQGIGPVIHDENRKRLAKMFKKLDLINVRDNQSKLELESMGVTENIIVTTDSVFSLEKPSGSQGEQILGEFDIDTTKLTIGISVRPWKDMTDKLVDEMTKVVKHFEDKDINLVLLPFHYPHDLEVSRKIFDKITLQRPELKTDNLVKNGNLYVVSRLMNEDNFLSVMANMDIMVSMRLHGLIFATVCHAYPIGISYDPKIQSLLAELGREKAMEIEDIDAKKLITEIEYAIENIEKLREETAVAAEEMREMARNNNKMVKELIAGENTRS